MGCNYIGCLYIIQTTPQPKLLQNHPIESLNVALHTLPKFPCKMDGTWMGLVGELLNFQGVICPTFPSPHLEASLVICFILGPRVFEGSWTFTKPQRRSARCPWNPLIWLLVRLKHAGFHSFQTVFWCDILYWNETSPTSKYRLKYCKIVVGRITDLFCCKLSFGVVSLDVTEWLTQMCFNRHEQSHWSSLCSEQSQVWLKKSILEYP